MADVGGFTTKENDTALSNGETLEPSSIFPPMESADISEADLRTQLQERVKEMQTPEQLLGFINEVMSMKHDYGTVVVAIAQIMMAAFRVADRSPQGGITGFQASCVHFEIMRELLWIEGPCKVLSYEKMLYPQHEYRFDKTISAETMEWLKKEAMNNLEKPRLNEQVHPDVMAHWLSISKGNPPFGFKIAGDQDDT